MTTGPRQPFDASLLRVAADLRRQGIEPAAAGWHRVRRGIWLVPGAWSTLGTDERYQATVHATVLSCHEPETVVIAGHSAAAVWGMPSIEAWPDHVSVLDPGGRSGSSRHIRMVHGLPAEPVLRHGLLVTPAARTVIDLARTGTLDTALASADYALREGLCSRNDLEKEAGLIPHGGRGRSIARLTVELTDGLSGSPGEPVEVADVPREPATAGPATGVPR